MVRYARLRLSHVSIFAMVVCAGLLAALCMLVVPAIPAGAAGTSQGPVAEYSFDQNPGEGTTVEDVSGDGNTATIHGAAWTEHGRYGGAMNFDAEEGDYLSVPDSEELALTEEFTLEAWVRPGSGENYWGPLIDKQIPGEEGLSDYAYFLYASDYVEDRPHGSMPEGAYLHAIEGTPKRVWSHVALTYDGAAIRLYVDGQLVDEGVGAPPPTSAGELEIGGATEQGTYLDGRIDEVRIYDRVLSQGEVDADMETPIAAPKSPPVAEYSFDHESETAVDFSGHKNEGTIEAAEWVPDGRYGGALNFDGEESCVTVPDSETLHPSEEFTLEAWVKPKDSPTADPLGFKAGEGTAKYAAVLGFENYGRPQGWVDGEELKGPKSIGTDVWTHLAFTYDGDTLRLYVDGEIVDEEVVGELQLDTEEPEGEEPLYIGCDPPAWGNHFHGKIDEPKVYDRALLPWEVAADMEAPIETPRQEPIAAYSFDEGEPGDETATDITGHGHTATLEGETEWTRGRYGGALGFEKEGDCASVADSPELRLTEEFSIEAWVRPQGGIFEDPVVVRESGGYGIFGLGIGSTEEGYAEAFIGEGGEAETAVGGPEIGPDEWVHLAATYDGARIRLYVDGELAATQEASHPWDEAGALKIGCDAADGPFWGRIDEVRVYDWTLNAGEIASDMETPLQTPKQTPVAKYSFDEKNEETATDLTGDGHTATVEGAKWTEHGRYGGAYEFDAEEEDVLKIPASKELDFNEEFTLEAWVRPSGGENKEAPLIDKQEGTGLGYFLYEGGTVSDRPVGAVAEGQEHIHADDPLPAHAWSHVALTFTGNRTYLYVDGELVDNGGAEPVVTSEGELEIGGSTDTGEYFDGKIDEVRIYNRGLSAAEVGADKEASILTFKRGPVAAYSFDEGEGTTVEDVTGDGHTATIEGAEWKPGKYGGGLRFNGTSSCVSIGDATDLRFGEEFTLESWVRPEGELTDDPVIFKEGSGFLNYGLGIGRVTSGMAEGSIGVSASPNHKEVVGAEALEANLWSHLAVTFDGATLRLYVDGELVDTEAVEGPSSGREGALKIGCDGQYGEHFRGRVDELRLYNRALDAREVQKSSAAEIVHATVYSGNPSAEGELIAEEWAQLGSDNSRREDANGITTSGEIRCRTSSETRCVSLRKEVPPTGYVETEISLGVSGSPSAGTLLLPRSQVVGREEAAGRLSEILAPWQTPPPGHSTRVIEVELSRSDDENAYEEPQPDASAWRFWVDAATRLPLKSELVLGEGGSTVSYYTYAAEPQNALSLPADFFFVQPPSEPPAECETSGLLGGWEFNPSGAVYPDPRFPAILNGAGGPVVLDPLGAAADGTEPRAILNGENGGIELTTSEAESGSLTWEITESLEQTLEPSSSGFVLRSVEHEVTAEILLSGGATVEDGSPSGTTTDDLITLPDPEAVAIVRAPPTANWTTRPCYTSEEMAHARAVHLESGGPPPEESSKPDIQSAESTAPVVVYVNPHPALKSVAVTDKYETCNGPHTKTAGEDGRVEFGGCPVGVKATFIVETPVTVASGTFEVAEASRTITVPAEGWTIQFHYRRVSGEGPVEGEEANAMSRIRKGPGTLTFGADIACVQGIIPPYKRGDTKSSQFIVEGDTYVRCLSSAAVDEWLTKVILESKNVLFNASGGYRERDLKLFSGSPIPGLSGPYTIEEGPEMVWERCTPGEARWRTHQYPLLLLSENPATAGIPPLVQGDEYWYSNKNLTCAG